MTITTPIDMSTVKGFLADDEAAALHHHALATAHIGPALEIGSYCGKSTVYLGIACQQQGNILYAVDHHRGSEEHQLGEEYHDPDLYDAQAGLMDTFREFRRVMRAAKLEDTVVPIVAPSTVASRRWATPLGMVFIDGGHSMEAALNDYRCWSQHVATGGILAIHDIFPNPADGGRPPYEIYQLACASGLFEILPMVSTLGVLRRL
ncbi:MAG: class I SAM-dependent methyltransferase [Gammaproteobacteria bacterium]|nr:MAG: class I SAM-dependent methyltransferase [Gammaproteobacteria bacterium]